MQHSRVALTRSHNTIRMKRNKDAAKMSRRRKCTKRAGEAHETKNHRVRIDLRFVACSCSRAVLYCRSSVSRFGILPFSKSIILFRIKWARWICGVETRRTIRHTPKLKCFKVKQTQRQYTHRVSTSFSSPLVVCLTRPIIVCNNVVSSYH